MNSGLNAHTWRHPRNGRGCLPKRVELSSDAILENMTRTVLYDKANQRPSQDNFFQ